MAVEGAADWGAVWASAGAQSARAARPTIERSRTTDRFIVPLPRFLSRNCRGTFMLSKARKASVDNLPRECPTTVRNQNCHETVREVSRPIPTHTAGMVGVDQENTGAP